MSLLLVGVARATTHSEHMRWVWKTNCMLRVNSCLQKEKAYIILVRVQGLKIDPFLILHGKYIVYYKSTVFSRLGVAKPHGKLVKHVRAAGAFYKL